MSFALNTVRSFPCTSLQGSHTLDCNKNLFEKNAKRIKTYYIFNRRVSVYRNTETGNSKQKNVLSLYRCLAEKWQVLGQVPSVINIKDPVNVARGIFMVTLPPIDKKPNDSGRWRISLS